MKAYKFVLAIIVLFSSNTIFSQDYSNLKLNEIMFYPQSGQNEFIEIYNLSETESIDLKDLKIKYYTSSADGLSDAGFGTILPPNSYAIILEGDHDIETGIYKSIIPQSALILKIDNNSFGSSGMANTTGRIVSLLAPNTEVIDSFTYSADNSQGYSDERIFFDSSNTESNWDNSNNSNGTPGYYNSVSPKKIDLFISSLLTAPEFLFKNEPLQVLSIIKNDGIEKASASKLLFAVDENLSGTFESHEIIDTITLAPISAKDSLSVLINYIPPFTGNSIIKLEIDSQDDENQFNNESVKQIFVNDEKVNFNSIILNEIMYAPANDEPEWVEIKNISGKEINLKNWTLGDASSKSTITNNDFLIEPDSFLVIAGKDLIFDYYEIQSKVIVSSVPSFNNGGDDVIVRDNYNRIIDSIKYAADWGITGKSIERKFEDASSNEINNWGIHKSLMNGSPGRTNSVTPKNYDLELSELTIPKQFIITGDSLQINAIITNIGRNQSSNAELIFLINDLVVFRKSISNLIPGAYENINFSFTETVQGNYSITTEIIYPPDEDLLNNNSSNIISVIKPDMEFNDLIINEIMYSPVTPEPEWIEIYNRSDKSLSLNKIQIADSRDTNNIFINNLILLAKDYIVIAKDSSFFSIYDNIDKSKIIINNFPLLNNDSDKILLLDSLNRVIDSLTYYSSMGGRNGKSLERIDPDNSTDQSGNWSSSIDTMNATPAEKNSVIIKDFDIQIKAIQSFPEVIMVNDNFSLTLEILNSGKKNAIFDLRISELNIVDSSETLISITNGITLNSRDSSSIIISENLVLHKDMIILAEAIFDEDEIISNNNITIELRPNYREGFLFINEIMFDPENDEPEWIEIINKSQNEINIKNFVISDVITTPFKKYFTLNNLNIQPEEFMIVAKDSSFIDYYTEFNGKLLITDFATLNNNYDGIVIKDNYGNTLDSVFYKGIWLKESGNSIERRSFELSSDDSLNWITSTDSLGGTPGYINSRLLEEFDISITELNVSPKFPLTDDIINIEIKISNNGLSDVSINEILLSYNKVSDTNNIILSSLKNVFINKFSEYVYSFSDRLSNMDEDIVVHAKIFLTDDSNVYDNYADIKIEFQPSPSTLIINEIMYSPSNGEPEWIELLNKGNSPIDLRNWSIKDRSTSVILADSTFYIEPDSFIVISRESSLLNYYSITSKLLFINLPSLNNTGDDISIIDKIGNMHDSVSYKNTWGGGYGKSLERIDIDKLANDSTNWSTSVNIYNATPGKVNSVTPKFNDLQILSIMSDKDYYQLNEDIIITVGINQKGSNPTGNFEISVFLDTDNDSTFSESEKIYQEYLSLNILNFVKELSINSANLRLGNNYIKVVITDSTDEDITNNFSHLNINIVEITVNRFDLIINEINYAPSAPEPEWIEIYNRSENEIEISGYKIADSRDTMTILNKSFKIRPDEFLVIVKDSLLLDIYYDSLNAIVNIFPLLNNDKDKVLLLDSLNRVIDSLEYSSSWGGKYGKSLERINSEIFMQDSSNWGSSTTMLSGTPGKKNSISAKDHDIAITDFYLLPDKPLLHDDVEIFIKIKNSGKQHSSFSLNLFSDTNIDSIPDLQLSSQELVLNTGEEKYIKLDFSVMGISSEINLIVSAVMKNDEDTTNNYLYISVFPQTPFNSVIINEVMFNPSGGEPEWFELYNPSNDTIDIRLWKISDIVSTPSKSVLSDNKILIAPKNYLLVSKDSTILNYYDSVLSDVVVASFASLNNDEDGLAIYDRYNNVIDSIYYKSNWQKKYGHSLERKSIELTSTDSLNWSISESEEKATPGNINSTSIKKYDLMLSSVIAEPKNPKLNEQIGLELKIKNIGSLSAGNFTVNIFNSYNDDDATNLFAEVEFDSLLSFDSLVYKNERKLELKNRLNIIVELFYAEDEDISNNKIAFSIYPGGISSSILISELLFNSATNQSEWIELYNNFDTPINLKNWKVSDVESPTEAIISQNDLYLDAGEYLVISSDSNIINMYDHNFDFIIRKFGTLGNTSDGIVIKDQNNSIIDSIYYSSSWGNKKGKSLERYSFQKSSNDSSNWRTSLSNIGATPGYSNSLNNLVSHNRNDIIVNEIMFAPSSINSEFIELYNNSASSINIAGWYLKNENGSGIELADQEIIVMPQDYYIIAANEKTANYYNLISNFNTLNTSDLGLLNDEKTILLYDSQNNLIDSVYYSVKMHNKNFIDTENRSLEKINPVVDPNNSTIWSSCVNSTGATPGEINSIFTNFETTNKKLHIEPNPFSPDNDGFDDFSFINYELSQAVSQVRVKIFDSQGRLVRNLENNLASGSKGSIIFDGRNDDGNFLRIGIYIVYLEAVSESDGVTEKLKDVIVIARKF